jgi:hypothetical protein
MSLIPPVKRHSLELMNAAQRKGSRDLVISVCIDFRTDNGVL